MNDIRTTKWELAGNPLALYSLSLRYERRLVDRLKAMVARTMLSPRVNRSVDSPKINTRVDIDSELNFVMSLHGHDILRGKLFREVRELSEFLSVNEIDFDPVRYLSRNHEPHNAYLLPMRVNLCGYVTRTTMTRLRDFGVNISVKRGTAYIRSGSSSKEIPDSGWSDLVLPLVV